MSECGCKLVVKQHLSDGLNPDWQEAVIDDSACRFRAGRERLGPGGKMTPEQFDAASLQERNEAIARAKGWRRATVCGNYGWVLPDGTHRITTLDWQGDDGLAFRELWPLIYEKVSCRLVSAILSGTPWHQIFTTDGGALPIAAASKVAHALCKAFLALKEVSK